MNMLFVIGAFILAVAAASFITLQTPAATGKIMARQETVLLKALGADPNHVNPPAQQETFAGELSPVWAFDIINGAGQVGHAPAFHNTTIRFDRGLVITQLPDPDFEQESPEPGQPASQRYNNATLIGFQGYQPIPGEDVVFQARMQVSSNFYGSAGFMVQPLETLQPDGSFKGRFGYGAFTLFGIGFIGPESSLFGKNGVTVQKVINWWPEEVKSLPIDPYQPHTYQLRLHWVDERNWLGVVSVDGQDLAFMDLPPFGPLEVHIWGDNYLLGSSWKGVPEISFQNGEEKWIRFEQVSAWTEKAQQ